MKFLLAFLQIVLALHTAAGAVWKFIGAERAMPTLASIPHALWLGMGAIEVLCAIALIAALVDKRAATLAPIAAAFVGAEMLFFCGVHLASGSTAAGPVVYWLTVAVICAFVVYGRLALKPARHDQLA